MTIKNLRLFRSFLAKGLIPLVSPLLGNQKHSIEKIQIYGPKLFLKQITSGLELIATYRPNFYPLIHKHLKTIFFLGHISHQKLEQKPNQILPAMNILIISHQYHLQCSALEIATLLIYETFLCLYSKKYPAKIFKEIEAISLKNSLQLSRIFNTKSHEIESFIQNYG